MGNTAPVVVTNLRPGMIVDSGYRGRTNTIESVAPAFGRRFVAPGSYRVLMESGLELFLRPTATLNIIEP